MSDERINVVLSADATAGRTMGSLTAADLGSTMRFRDGGALYEGQLHKVEHEAWLKRERRTWVHIVNGEWRHTGYSPADTPCEVIAAAEAGEQR